MKNIEKHWDEITEIRNKKGWGMECCIRAIINGGEHDPCEENCKACWERVGHWMLEETEE